MIRRMKSDRRLKKGRARRKEREEGEQRKEMCVVEQSCGCYRLALGQTLSKTITRYTQIQNVRDVNCF